MSRNECVTYTSGSDQEKTGTSAYVDAEGPKIENKLERACGTKGRSVIWPSNSRAQRPGTLVPHDGQQPLEVRW